MYGFAHKRTLLLSGTASLASIAMARPRNDHGISRASRRRAVGLFIFLGPADMAWRTALHIGGCIPIGMALLMIPLLPNAPNSRHHVVTAALVSTLSTFFRATTLSSPENDLAMLAFSAARIAGSLLFGAAQQSRSCRCAVLVGYAGMVGSIFGLQLAGQNSAAIIHAVMLISFFQTAGQYVLYGVLAAGGTAHSVLLAAVPVALTSLLAVLTILERHSTAIVEEPCR